MAVPCADRAFGHPTPPRPLDAPTHGPILPVIHVHDNSLPYNAPALGGGRTEEHVALGVEIVVALGSAQAPFIAAPAPPTLVPDQTLHLILGDGADLTFTPGSGAGSRSVQREQRAYSYGSYSWRRSCCTPLVLRISSAAWCLCVCIEPNKYLSLTMTKTKNNPIMT